ncbi:MAG TPA: hypothetical protein VGX23_01620 [Actinocrinis sp.]|nr:hypothetical protein [Actinocrinis sp.]
MPRITDETRAHNEAAIRAAMDRLLRGQIPPGGKCDLKTLAAEAGVPRTGFYPKGARPGPYQDLAAEFERRLELLRQTGQAPDPREAQITRLKVTVEELRARVSARDEAIEELTAFKTLAISRLAAQHEEIGRLRTALDGAGNIRTLPVRTRAAEPPTRFGQ